MAYVDEQGRPKPPVAGDETSTLVGFLEFLRATFAWKCGGLDAAGLAATLAPTTMTLGGMLKHLAHVEADVCSGWLHSRALGSPWDAVDWDADPDWDWRTAAEDSPEQLWAQWRDAVARSRAEVEEALADGGLEHLGTGITNARGEAPTLRFILFTMIEEYGRHVGHADLLRESVDGLTGE